MINKGFKSTYLHTLHAELSAIFNFAIKYYGLRQNPVRICGNIGSTKPDSFDFWTFDEFKQFISCIDDMQDKLIFELLFYGGMRKGELLALTLEDFDFEKSLVKINKNYAVVNGQHLILTPKTKKSIREITLPDFIMQLAKDFVNGQYKISSKDRVFDISFRCLGYRMKKYCQKSGVKTIKVHSIRHSAASLLINQNFSPLMISERLGHENVQTTLQIYSHLYPKKQEEISQYLETLKV